MSEKKKVHHEYEEGHKRETRKSYQTFIEGLMSDPSAEEASCSAADTSDDASVRRSKRTPVPKRGFKLIDDYDAKNSSGKKKFKGADETDDGKVKEDELSTPQYSSQSSQGEDTHSESEAVNKNLSATLQAASESEKSENEQGGSNDSPAPRKSGRARKAKTFEDSVMPEIKSRSKKPAELATSDLSDAESEILKKKVLQKLTANTPIAVKEETIIGKDNVEYVYRNVFVTEILDSKRKRKCRLSKDSDDSDKASKSGDTPGKDGQEKEIKDSKKEVVKESPSVKKKGDLKLKITDKGIKGKVCDISPDVFSPPPVPTEKKKRKSIDKERDILPDNRKSPKGSNEFRKSTEVEEPKNKRKSGDRHELKKCIDAKRSSIEQLYLGTDCEKIKASPMFDEEFTSFRSEDSNESFSRHIIPKSEEKKKVKFAEKEEIKLFERDDPEVVPTLAESVKSRRKEKEKKHQDTESEDSQAEQSSSPLQESRKNKRKKDEQSSSPMKEQKSPSKNEKNKIHKDSEKKENKKSRSSDINERGKDHGTPSSPKKDPIKKKLVLSPKKEKILDSASSDHFEPSAKRKKSKHKQEVSIVTTDRSPSAEHKDAPIVLTFKSSDITNISPPSSQKKKESKSHSYDKVSTKLTKKSDLKKNKKQSKKKAKKLIVSFPSKKKKSLDKDDLTDNEDMESLSPSTASMPMSFDSPENIEDELLPPMAPLSGDDSLDSEPPIFLDPVPELLLDTTPPDGGEGDGDDDEGSKHKKKSKKKSKMKLKKHQKIVNVETFPVVDQTIVKVKKKKIYKNKNGEKVLIRLIKNHCNRNGDIVKTETIVVDNDSPPIEEEKGGLSPGTPPAGKKSSLPSGVKEELDEKPSVPEKSVSDKAPQTKKKIGEKKVEKKKSGASPADKKPEKKINEKKTNEKKNTTTPDKMEQDKLNDNKKIKDDSPDYDPRLNNDTINHAPAVKRKSKFKQTGGDTKINFKSTGDKKSMFKKTTSKVMKKPLSRPANKNVTVGGKVVGKTTKGMKKTGGANVEPPPFPVTKGAVVKSNHLFEPISPAEVPNNTVISEPKNVYNFFCRKYRPIVVQQFPKADFSEISSRLSSLWKTLSESERQEQRDKFEEIHAVSQQKLAKLGRLSPTLWSESDLKFIKKNISENDSYNEVFSIPKYPVKRLSAIDMGAHLSLLGDSLNVISGALQQQSSMTVHGAMSVLLDSILSALAPLVFFTSHIPEMKAIDDAQQARILDNLAYILPGL